jgi:hypothetical protein
MPMLERREPAGFAHGFDGTARGPSHRPALPFQWLGHDHR